MPRTNAAQSHEYRAIQQAAQPLFSPQNRTEQHMLTFPTQHTLHIDSYSGKADGRNLSGSLCRLHDSEGDTVTQWQSLDDSAAFYQYITHSNGRDYLLFRQDLYGYSVLDFATGEIMQYLPRAALDGAETFIWTEAHYNPANDMLAVGGCYWAAPYALLLADFSNPMSAPPRMTDALYEYIPNFWDDYDGEIDFHAWRGTDLLYTAPLLEEKNAAPKILTQAQYLAWLE